MTGLLGHIMRYLLSEQQVRLLHLRQKAGYSP